MKYLRLSVVVAVCVLASLVWIGLRPQKAAADPLGNSIAASYLTTITDATTGAFSSRSVITLHNDHTLAAVDSTQSGTDIAFTSQHGAWNHAGNGSLEATTIDFTLPNAGVDRVDYVFDPDPVQGEVKGTITLTVFPINGNPFGGGGIVVGTFKFTGQRITTP